MRNILEDVDAGDGDLNVGQWCRLGMFDELQWALPLACASGRSRVTVIVSLRFDVVSVVLIVSIIIAIFVKHT